MNFSVIIPTCNRHDELHNILEELAPAIDKLQIIVIDDSDEREPIPHSMYETPNFIYDYHQGKRGAVNCINIGISRATNDHIILLGDDCHIKDIKQFLSLLEYYYSYGVGDIIGFRIIDKVPKHIPTVICNLAWRIFGLPFPETGCKNGNVNFTSLFAFRKSKLKALFDSNFIGSGFNADSDFLLTNGKPYYAYPLIVFHDELGLPNKSKSEKLHNHHLLITKHCHILSWLPKYLLYRLYLH